MYKDTNYRLHVHLKYWLIHDLLRKYFTTIYDMAIFQKKVQFWWLLGISGYIWGILGLKTGQTSILGHTKKEPSEKPTAFGLLLWSSTNCLAQQPRPWGFERVIRNTLARFFKHWRDVNDYDTKLSYFLQNHDRMFSS